MPLLTPATVRGTRWRNPADSRMCRRTGSRKAGTGWIYFYDQNNHANPLDEFSNPKIGSCESTVTKYIKEINETGRISNPIEV